MCQVTTTTHIIILYTQLFQSIGQQLNGQWQLIIIEIDKQASINWIDNWNNRLNWQETDDRLIDLQHQWVAKRTYF
jgi:hypothetical protein